MGTEEDKLQKKIQKLVDIYFDKTHCIPNINLKGYQVYVKRSEG